MNRVERVERVEPLGGRGDESPRTGQRIAELPSNSAAMREALKSWVSFAEWLIENAGKDALGKVIAENVLTIRQRRDEAEAALAKPPRNCDVGTAEEQEVRFRNYCWNHSSRDKNMECQCPIDAEGKAGCKLTWAQMPYEEGGAK